MIQQLLKVLNLTVTLVKSMQLWEKMVLEKVLCKIVAGHSAYRVTAGDITFNGDLFLKLSLKKDLKKGFS